MRFLILVLPVFAGAALGCAGTVTGAAGDAEAVTTTSAVVVIERATDGAHTSRAEGSARFVRVAAPMAVGEAWRVVGAAVDLPLRGGCASVTSLVGGLVAPGESAPVVELVDVGAVSLSADGADMRLLPRQLPDVTDVVSGVVYDRAAEPGLLPAATRYTVRVAGGGDLAGFEVTASAPSDPTTISVGGEDSAGGLVASGPTVDLTWPSAGSDDLVYVDVRPSDVRCVFGDVGHGSISTQFFDDSGILVVHRLRREALRAPGIDSGEIRFDFTRSLSYVRR